MTEPGTVPNTTENQILIEVIKVLMRIFTAFSNDSAHSK
jgi:hypothetical protein